MGVKDGGVDSSKLDTDLESVPLEVLEVLQTVAIDDTNHTLAAMAGIGVGALLTVEENGLVLIEMSGRRKI